MIIWTEQGTQDLAVSGQVETAWDMMGGSLAKSQRIDASENPIYIVGRGLGVTK
jgi:hypothetical protein